MKRASRRTIWLRMLWASLTLACCGAVLLWLGSLFSIGLSEGQEHQTDQALASNLQLHQSEFETLRTIFASEEAPRIWDNLDPPQKDVPLQRLKQYKALFDKLGLSSGVERSDDAGGATFWASTQGMLGTGSAKGYAYSQAAPPLVVDDLDKYGAAHLGGSKAFRAYRHLHGKWYLFLRYDP